VFHLDDYSLFSEPVVTSAMGWWEVWHPARVRPLTYFTFWLNYQAGGESPFGYHVVNWALHLVSVWLCSLALGRLLPAGAALLATAVFALHPIQTETVAYVFARSTLLCGLFCLAALVAWTRGRHGWAVAMHALAMLAKEEAVALPLVFALLHWSISRNHREWRFIGAMFAVAVLLGGRGLVVTLLQPGTGAGAGAGISAVDYLATQSYVLARYALQMVAPIALNFDPDIPVLNNWRGWAFWLVWLVVAVLALGKFSQARAGFWVLAAFAFLAPTSSLIPIADLSADRRLYLVLMALGAAVAPYVPRRAVYVLAFVMAWGAFTRAQVWRTEESLWRDTVTKSPFKARPRVHLSRALPPAEGLRVLGDLTDPLAESERGRVLLELQRPAEALQSFGKVLAAMPGDAGALTNRGVALAALGQSEAARADFERALAIDRCYPPALRNLQRPPCPR
jgi:protein O-mannosyl-transferase